MWNMLIVLVIAIIIFALNPLKYFGVKNVVKTNDVKTKTEINQIVEQTQQQVDYSKQLQQQGMNNVQNQ